MKKKDLEKKLSSYGWWFHCHGGKHDKWTNGEDMESVPRHNEVDENLSKKILRVAREKPPKMEKK